MKIIHIIILYKISTGEEEKKKLLSQKSHSAPSVVSQHMQREPVLFRLRIVI